MKTTDQRQKTRCQRDEFFVVGKLYVLTKMLGFKLVQARSVGVDKKEPEQNLPHEVVLPKFIDLYRGDRLLYLGEHLNTWLTPRRLFLTEDGQTVVAAGITQIQPLLEELVVVVVKAPPAAEQ